MRRARWPRLRDVALVALSIYCGIAALRAMGVGVRDAVMVGTASVSAALAFGVAAWTAASIWRGPPIVSFPRDEAVWCDRAYAQRVRDAAQVRGTMGGAGYVNRGPLAIGALGWTAAGASASAVALGPELSVSVPLAGIAALAAAGAVRRAFPAVPFYYRETHDGAMLVHPAAAWVRLMPGGVNALGSPPASDATWLAAGAPDGAAGRPAEAVGVENSAPPPA